MSFSFPLGVVVPYPGLRPFRSDESVVFFGRDQQIDDILARLKRRPFLGVVGTSGCGKSSLIRAGMLPALECGLMGELGSSWFIADMKPGDAPLTNLAKALMQSGVLEDRWSNTPEGIALLTAALRRSDVSLVNLIQQVRLPKFTNLLILADQFEEIFRFQQSDPNEALAFVNLLLATGHDRSAPIYVVLTMRSDFLGQCALFPGLPEALNDSQYLCPRLTRDQLSEAIEGPASVFGGEVERALVTQIVNDAGANSDHLPLVQHVLARIWRSHQPGEHGPDTKSDKIILRLKDYQDRGGLNGFSTAPLITQDAARGRESSSGRYGIGPGYSYRQNALSEHADEAYRSLGESQDENSISGPDHKPSRKQMIAQMLFRCLAEQGPSGQYVRRPVRVQDVAAVADCLVAEVIEVVDVFRREDRSFLTPSKPKAESLKPGESDLKPETMLDISHESLIRQWQRFGGQSERIDGTDSSLSWMALEEQSRRRYRRLAEAAESVSTAGLLRDPELSFLDKWWQKFQPKEAWGNGCVKDSFQRTKSFLDRSRKAAQDEKQRQQEDEKRELQRAYQQARTTRRWLAVVGMVALIAIGLGTYASIARSRAVVAEAEAIKQKDIAAINEQTARDSSETAQVERVAAMERAEEARRQELLAKSNAELAMKKEMEANKQKTIAELNAKEAIKEKANATQQAETASAAQKEAEEAKSQLLIFVKLLGIEQDLRQRVQSKQLLWQLVNERIEPLHKRLSQPAPNSTMQTLASFLQTRTIRFDRDSRILLQPVGKFEQSQMVEDIRNYLSHFYEITVEILPTKIEISIPANDQRARNGKPQWRAETVMSVADTTNRPHNTILLVITENDIWSEKLNYVFGKNDIKRNSAILSLDGLEPPKSSPDANVVALRRALKIAAFVTGQAVGIRDFAGYECCMNPPSSLTDLDRSPLQFCPECESKVWWIANSDPLVRYEALKEFALLHKLQKEHDHWEKAVLAIRSGTQPPATKP